MLPLVLVAAIRYHFPSHKMPTRAADSPRNDFDAQNYYNPPESGSDGPVMFDGVISEHQSGYEDRHNDE